MNADPAHWSAIGWLVSALEADHPGYLREQHDRAVDGGFTDTAEGFAGLLAISSSDRGRREHPVPCRRIGCPATTYSWQALCGRHLNSDEPTAPRRLTAVDPPSAGDVDDQAPTGAHPPAGRGQPRTA